MSIWDVWEKGFPPQPTPHAPCAAPSLCSPFEHKRGKRPPKAPSVPSHAASLCSCSFANYTLTHTLFGEWESMEGNLGELLGAGSRLYPPGHLAVVPQFWHAGRAAARAPAAVRGELPGPRPTVRKEGNKNTKKLHRVKPEAPASFRQGTRRCRAPTL